MPEVPVSPSVPQLAESATDAPPSPDSSSSSRSLGSFIAQFDVLLLAVAYRLFTASQTGKKLGEWDERVYLLYAKTFHAHGVAGLRDLVARFAVTPSLKNNPPPLRVLVPVVDSAICRLLGGYTVEHLAMLTLVEGLVAVAIAHALFRRWMRPRVAALAALLLAASPLATAMARRAMQDGLVAVLFLGAVLLLEHARDEGRAGDLAGLTVLVALACLAKETAALFLPALAAVVWLDARSSRRVRLLVTGALGAGAALYVVTAAWVAGGVHAYVAFYRAYDHIAKTMVYAKLALRGPWFTYLLAFLLASPLVALLATAGAFGPAGATEARGRRLSLLYLALGLAPLALLPIKHPRAALPLEPFLCALAAVGVAVVAERIGRSRAATAGSVAFCALGFLLLVDDAHQFHHIFVSQRLSDPTSLGLAGADGVGRAWPPDTAASAQDTHAKAAPR